MAKQPKTRRLALACPECQKSSEATAAALLASVAVALNACRDAGLQLRFRHGIVQCEEGLVLDLPDGTWVARTRLYTPFAAAADGLDD